VNACWFEVNGVACEVPDDPGRSLLHVLREDLDLTGCKPGCSEGECGACTVLVDGRAVRSCVTPASAVAGRQVTTIEGLAGAHPLQEAFLDLEALQCGYCTPGMIMSGVDLLSRIPSPTVAEIVQGMRGNLCRCGAYPRIVAAIGAAAVTLAGGRDG
jgi:nicotinate dehydrogenase subunit A